MISALVLVLIFLVALLVNAFFAGYETGFVACNPTRVRHLALEHSRGDARALLSYLQRPERLITIVLLGTNLATITATIVITRSLGGVWATLIATPAILVFGEIVPKSMFRQHPTRFSLACVRLVQWADRLLFPIVGPVTWFAGLVSRALPGESKAVRVLMRTPEDMRVLVDESADRGAIDDEEKEMIHSVMDLRKRYVKEIMVPRIDIAAVSLTASRAELIEALRTSGYTRLPVYKDTVDEIVGMVNVFHVLKDPDPDAPDIRRFMRDVIYVPDTMKLDDVLKTMRDRKQSMAIVVGEYGVTEGLVTVEDILEEIFGEIQDEHDAEELPIRRVGEHDFVIKARTELEDVSQVIGAEIVDDEVETIGGWLMHVTGRIPQKGEVIVHDRFRITILDGGPSHLTSILLEVLPRPSVRE